MSREAGGVAAFRVSLGRRVNQGSQVDRANPEVRAGQGGQEERGAEAVTGEAVTGEPVAWEAVEVMAAEVAMEAALDRSADYSFYARLEATPHTQPYRHRAVTRSTTILSIHSSMITPAAIFTKVSSGTVASTQPVARPQVKPRQVMGVPR